MNSSYSTALIRRHIRDRPLQPHQRDETQLQPNIIAHVATNAGQTISLVSKARPYSATPYDVMVILLSDTIGDITKLPKAVVADFFKCTEDVRSAMETISHLDTGVGLNQHPIGPTLEYRSISGLKNRVQTLLPIHAHVYELATGERNQVKWTNLSAEEQQDIRDPLLPLSATILQQSLRNETRLTNFSATITTHHHQPPFGLHIDLPISIDQFLAEHQDILSIIQRHFVLKYSEFAQIFGKLTDNGSYTQLPAMQADANLKSYLNQISTQPDMQVIHDVFHESFFAKSRNSYGYRFVNGPAATYSILRIGDNKTRINIQPRLASRGNSPESLGIYKKVSGVESADDISKKVVFYDLLIKALESKYAVTKGAIMKVATR